MEPKTIITKFDRSIRVWDAGLGNLAIRITNTASGTNTGTFLTLDECQAVEDALATARKEATPTDSPESEPATGAIVAGDAGIAVKPDHVAHFFRRCDVKFDKPDAEVIASHRGDALVRIGSNVCLIHQAEFGVTCFQKTREKAQAKMLAWGHSVDDAYHATQAIDS